MGVYDSHDQFSHQSFPFTSLVKIVIFQLGPISLSWFKFNPGMAKNHMSSKVWDEVTYPFPNFNREVVEYSPHDL